MKKLLIITLFSIILSATTIFMYLAKNYYSEIGRKYYIDFLNYQNPSDKNMVFVDKYNEPFFSKTVIFGGELVFDEVDNISESFLTRKCKLYDEKNLLLSFIFNINFEKLDALHVGCIENTPNNVFERYGYYHYLQYNGNPKAISKKILDKIKYSPQVYGLQGISRYLFAKNYNDLNTIEKIYIFYEIESKNNLSIDFKKYKKIYFNIDNDQTPKFFKNQKSLDLYPHISEVVLNEINEYGFDKIKDGAIIHTSFDPEIYKKIIPAVSEYIEKKDPKLDSAGVIIDAEKGEIISLYGSKNPNSRLNRALKLRRQIGSIFKPIVYIAAFEAGIKPDDIIEDKPTTYGKGKNAYSPKNFDDFYMGKTKVKNALIYSLNNGTLQVALKAGLKNVANMAENLGLEAKPLLGFCLGSGEYSPLQIARYFSVIACNGVKKDIGFIRAIQYEDNQTIEFTKESKRVFSEETAKIVKSILKQVVKIGTARGAGLLPETYGKTGTTNDSKDVWFASVYDRYVIVVWIGRDDYKTINEKATGGGLAAPLVARIQKLILQ
jgi:penicillin-binding protein 1A